MNGREKWKDIPGTDGFYQASTKGRIRSVDRLIVTVTGVERWLTGKVLVPSDDSSGYPRLCLGSYRTAAVHTLVLETFVGPRPDDLECCHRDGNRRNNRLSNIRWDTRAANRLDGPTQVRAALARWRFKTPTRKTIRQKHQDGKTMAALAREYECSPTVIRRVVNGGRHGT